MTQTGDAPELRPLAMATLAFAGAVLFIAPGASPLGRAPAYVLPVALAAAVVGLVLTRRLLSIARDALGPDPAAAEPARERTVLGGMATLMAVWTLITAAGVLAFALL